MSVKRTKRTKREYANVEPTPKSKPIEPVEPIKPIKLIASITPITPVPAGRLQYSTLVMRRAPGLAGRKSALYPELNMRELAKRAEIDPAYLSRILNGLQRPGLAVAMRIANVLGVSVEQIANVYKPKAQPKVQPSKAQPSKAAKRNAKSPSPAVPAIRTSRRVRTPDRRTSQRTD